VILSGEYLSWWRRAFGRARLVVVEGKDSCRQPGHLYRRIRAAARTLAERWGVVVDAVSVCPERDEWEAHWREVAEFEKGGSALLNLIKPARPAGYQASCRQRRDCRR
jgi:hypothetical protein